MRRALAVLALLPAAYATALTLAAFFYGMGTSTPDTWSWPTVFRVASWILGVAVMVGLAALLAKVGYDELTGGEDR